MSSPMPDPANAEDLHTITAIVERWTQAFAAGDASLVADDYAADAESTNAFGGARRDGPAIAAFLQELFGRGLWATATGPRHRRRSASCARTWWWSAN